MLIKRYRGVFDFLCAAVPVKFFGSLLRDQVWVISDPVACLASGLKGLKSWAKRAQGSSAIRRSESKTSFDLL